MTISSSLSAGVAGLNANATRLATISDNISNSATFGYKRATADFESLVIGGTRGAGRYSAGGVRAMTQRLIDENGPLISTSNPMSSTLEGTMVRLSVAVLRRISSNGVSPINPW